MESTILKEIEELGFDFNTRAVIKYELPPAPDPPKAAPPPKNDLLDLLLVTLRRTDVLDTKSLLSIRLLNMHYYHVVNDCGVFPSAIVAASSARLLAACRMLHPRLESLDLFGEREENNYSYLIHNCEFPRLKSLSVDTMSKTPAWVFLQQQAAFPALTSLSLEGIDAIGFTRFTTLPRWNLKELFIGCTGEVLLDSDVIRGIGKFPKLRKLTIKGAGIQLNSPCASPIDLPYLQVLEILGNDRPANLRLGKFLQSAVICGPRFHRLALDGVDKFDISDIQTAPWLKSLTHLSLTASKEPNVESFPPQGRWCAAVMAALQGGRLMELELVGFEDLLQVMKVIQLPNLRRLKWIDGGLITLNERRTGLPPPRAICHLGNVLAPNSLPSLKTLHLSKFAYLKGVHDLATLFPELKELNFQGLCLDADNVNSLFLDVLPMLEECNLNVYGAPLYRN